MSRVATKSEAQGRPDSAFVVPPGYKRTEVGVIPEDWTVEALGPHIDIVSGESPSKFRFAASGTPYFKVEQLNNSGKYLGSGQTGYFITDSSRVPKGSLLFPKRGASIMLNKIRILEEDGYMDTNLMALTVRGDLFSEYLFYAMSHIRLWTFADVTSIPQINNKHIKPLAIPFPTAPEQRAIAKALSDADELLGALDKLIAKKQAIKRAAMQQLLTGMTRLPGFDRQWNTLSMGRIGATYGGLSGKTKADFGVGSSQYVPFLNVLENVRLDPQALARVRVKPSEKQNRVEAGDLLFNGTSETPGDLAMGAVLTDPIPDLYLNSFCFGFRLRNPNEHDALFLAYVFRGPVGRRLLYSLAQGATRYNLSKAQFKRLEVPLPDHKEQEAIATVLSDMDVEIGALERRREKTKAIKQGMMQALLNGRVRLISQATNV